MREIDYILLSDMEDLMDEWIRLLEKESIKK
jgi:hypothetical protein